MKLEDRVAALERQVAELRAELVALRPRQPSEQRQAQQVRIMTPPLMKVALPTPDEFRRLLDIVVKRYPVLKPREDPADYATQFRAAFIRLAHCGRRDTIDAQRGLSWWTDDCQEWCRKHQVQPTWVGGAAFATAVIASGDVRFVMDDWPHGFCVALQFGGGGYPAKDWWRRALAGTLLEPSPSPYPQAPRSPARAFVGG